MELRQLNTFATIARLQSFSKAAQELGYAQSSITSQIQLLEKELEVKLFERLGHQIALTTEGKKLLPVAEQMMNLLKEAKNLVGKSHEPSGTLVIGATESLCVTRLPKLLKEYRLRYPQVELLIKFGGREEFLQALKDNTIDIAFFVDSPIINNEFTTVMKYSEPMTLLSTPEHPLAKRGKIYPKDLIGEPMILTEMGCGYRIAFDTIMSQFNIKPYSIIETGNVHAIKQLAMSGIGITFLPLTAVGEELHQNKLVSLKWGGPEFDIYTQVLIHKNKWMSAALKAFIELMNNWLSY